MLTDARQQQVREIRRAQAIDGTDERHNHPLFPLERSKSSSLLP